MTTALIVLSGGMDSATVVGLAMLECDTVEAVTFEYGQRHVTEIKAASDVTDFYNIPHHVIELPLVMVGGALTTDQEMPHLSYEELEATEGPSPTYVPYRNGTMLSVAAAFALSRNLDTVWAGMHAEDAAHWAYPDCTPEFIGAQAAAIYIGSYHQVRLITPLEWSTKQDVVEAAVALGVPLHLTLSCYEGTRPACGICPTCMGRLQAFAAAGVTDPIEYA